MYKINLENGEVRLGYEYSDLSDDAKVRTLQDQIEFEILNMDEMSPYWYLAEEMDRMRTPWFLGEAIYEEHEADLIATIEINGYLFDISGKMLPITYYVRGPQNECYDIEFKYGSKALKCTMEKINPVN